MSQDGAPPFPGGRACRITIADAETGEVLLVMVLPRQLAGIQRAMRIEPANAGATHEAERVESGPAVVGRIDRAKSELEEEIERYRAHLTARKLSEGTVRVYASAAQRLTRALGWSRFIDIDGPAIVAYLDAKAVELGWAGPTYNNELVTLRSFTRYLKRQRRTAEDVLADSERARGGSSRMSRAATTSELRAIIDHYVSAVKHDGRACPCSARYLHLEAHQGMRVGEPGVLRWGAVHELDERNGAIAHICWTPAMQKNRGGGRVQVLTALSPEAAAVLRLQRAWAEEFCVDHPTVTRKLREDDTNRVVLKTDPRDPDAIVFPFVPSRAKLRAVATALGVVMTDPYGRKFSTHSLRKWQYTALSLQAGAVGDQAAIDARMGAIARMAPPTPLLPGRPTLKAKSPEPS